jgi:hypothetical protein|tara:strand:+ start:370 stop:636 length:267 start_codon:yes stop_codon:yes gene_type:complete
MKNKDFNLFNLFSKTFKDRKMFGFIGFDELGLMPKVSKPIRQTEETEEEENCFCEGDIRDYFIKAQMSNEETLELPEDYFNSLTKGEK